MPTALTAGPPAWSQWVDMRKTTVCLLAAAVLMMGFGLWRGEGLQSCPRGSICAWSVWALAKNRHRWKIQLGATLATNPFFLNFFQGNISRGKLKGVCVPGLNCYSCPAAAASCPIGAVQAVIGSSKFHFAYYVVGFLLFIGVLLGRVVCGFLCPFGWFQELLHKIPTKKFSTKRFQYPYLFEICDPRSSLSLSCL